MSDRRGFTIIEVLVAVLVLTVGLLGLASGAATVTRMIGSGQAYSESAVLAGQQIEILRSQWRSCATMANGSTTKGMYQVQWVVSTPTTAANPARRVSVMVTVPRAGQLARVDTFTTTIPC